MIAVCELQVGFRRQHTCFSPAAPPKEVDLLEAMGLAPSRSAAATSLTAAAAAFSEASLTAFAAASLAASKAAFSAASLAACSAASAARFASSFLFSSAILALSSGGARLEGLCS